MTATAELVTIARSLPQPVDPYLGPCRAYVAEVAGAWRVVWALDGGRRQQPAGPAFPFDRAGGRDARRLSKLLNERSTPRPGQPDPTHRAGTAMARRDEAGQPEAPDGSAHAALDGASQSFPDPVAGRLTCSDACRERARYRRAKNEGEADAQGVTANLTPSRPAPDSSIPVPTSMSATRGFAPSESRSRTPEPPSPGSPGPDVLASGL